MEDALREIIDAIQSGTPIDEAWLSKLVRRHNARTRDGERKVAKRRLLPFFLALRAHDRERYESFGLSAQDEETLLRVLRMKPRRTASGVATITVITKPWPCSGTCLFCPSDIRMPKSYLAAEPACQRAERNFFDPYLQVRSRIAALSEMGHVTDKCELIILGGTWSDYPLSYQLWFIRELFRALNDCGTRALTGEGPEARERRYRMLGLTYDEEQLRERTCALQADIMSGRRTYNECMAEILSSDEAKAVAAFQRADWDELEREQRENEDATHRVVGLTIETRPDLINDESARTMRRMGCTKIQMGIQSLDEELLARNGRNVTVAQIASAFSALRTFGYKIQVHFMANLLGATLEADAADYERLVSDPRFLPDEVKLYPCALVESSGLMRAWERGEWRPYTEEELIDLLAHDLLVTPAYTRVSRMIRDISSTDIVCGNKKTNLRQMVEAHIGKDGGQVSEIRMREVATSDVAAGTLSLECVSYETTVSQEHFLEWVSETDRIAGFLRLSLPKDRPQAMIREVHVYGRVAGLHRTESGGAQHQGLGKELVERACAMAREAGYEAINVISAVGTRNYYRALGFSDADLYQRRRL